MYTKILVPLDGSPTADQVLPYARFFAEKLNARVELLLVFETLHARYNGLVAAERKLVLDHLTEVADSFPGALTVDCVADAGDPAGVIVHRAAAGNETLVAMATHGRSGAQRWLLGSVADKVLHLTPNHLFLVRAIKEMKAAEEVSLKRVLVALDGSLLAEKILPRVVELAKQMHWEVVLVRVWSLPSTASLGSEGYGMPNCEHLAEEITQEAKGYLEEKVRQLKKEGMESASSVLLEGNAAQEIVNIAKQTPESLAVMCTHGRSGLNRLVLGSVTDRVVRDSGGPVLVIPPL
jgi:nucleotide-binding universal stress UspA family protein